MRAARTLGASDRQILTRVVCRTALPTLVAGARIALGNAWTTLVAAELLAATSGPRLHRAQRLAHARDGRAAGRDGRSSACSARCSRSACACDALGRAVVGAGLAMREHGRVATAVRGRASPRRSRSTARRRSARSSCAWSLATSMPGLVPPRVLPSPAGRRSRASAALIADAVQRRDAVRPCAGSLQRWAHRRRRARSRSAFRSASLLAWLPPLRAAVTPVFELLRYIPPFAWVPIAVLWFGASTTTQARDRVHRRLSRPASSTPSSA